MNKKHLILFILLTLLISGGFWVGGNRDKNTEDKIIIPTEFVFQGETIALAWTDDNDGEDLIIQSDRKEYNGFSEVDVYFSITNTNRDDQEMDVVVWVGNGEVEVREILRIDGDSEKRYKIQDTKTKKTSIINNQIPNRKDVKGFTNGYVVNDAIKSGETNFYRVTIKYPPMSKGEFFVEAFGVAMDDAANQKTTSNEMALNASTGARCKIITPNNNSIADKNSLSKLLYHEADAGTNLQAGSTALRDYGANENEPLSRQSRIAYGHLDPWYSSSWSYRRQVVIDHSEVADVAVPATTYAGFPVYVHATGLSNIKADGADVRFTDSAGTELPREIEKYEDGSLDAWVKLTLTKDAGDSTDDIIYMYYGNASATEPAEDSAYGRENVWDDNFVMVQHLQEDPGPGGAGDIVDSTQYDNDGTAEASMTSDDQVAGKVDGSLDFDGADDNIDTNKDIADGLSEITVCAWVKPSVADTGTMYIAVENVGFFFSRHSTERFYFSVYNDSTSAGAYSDTNYADTDWHYVCGTYNGVYVDLFVDGVDDEAATNALTGNIRTHSADMFISYYYSTTNIWNGIIDEVRISNIARTSDWIATEYNNQNDVSAFLTINAEEDNTPTEFVSTIMQSGGDYGSLSAWETALAPTGQTTDLTATGTRVFSGSITGTLSADDAVELYRGGADTGIDGNVVAHTADGQILIDGITGISYELVAQNGDQWRYNDLTDNMWTITGTTGNELGDSAIAIAKIDGAWTVADTTAVTINDWTTSASNYIKVYTTESARHEGIAGTGYRLIRTSGNWDRALYIQEDYVRIEGLSISTTADSNHIIEYDGAGELRVSHSLLYYDDSPVKLEAFIINSGSVIKLWNNIIFNGGDRWAIDCNLPAVGAKAYIYNNTVVDYGLVGMFHGVRIQNADFLYLKNNLVQDESDSNCYNILGIGTFIHSNNISEDATSPDNAYDNLTVNFLDEANDNFHLAVSDTAARNAGADLSADANLSFSDDIDGETRPAGASWDIGADELKKTTQINTPHTNKWTDGLVGYWSFDGQDMDWASTTAEALDTSGNNNHGDVVNGAISVIGKVGQGMEFDGDDDYVNAGSSATLDNLIAETVSFWMLPQSTSSNYVVGKIFNLHVGINGYGLVGSILFTRIFTDFDNLRRVSNADAFLLNQWSHVVATSDGTGSSTGIHIYVNGIEVSYYDALASEAVGSPIDDNTYNFFIGDNNGPNFDGKIDEVRVYDRVLSADEIAEQYRVGARKFQTNTPITGYLTDGLVGHWTFNGEDMDWSQSTAEARDTSGNNNHGDVINGASSVIGKVGQGLDFDGVDDYVSITSNDFDDISPVTYSMWINADTPPNANGAMLFAKAYTRYILLGQTDGRLYFSVDYDGTNLYVRTVSDSVLYNNWSHIVITWDGSVTATNVHIYINGLEASYDIQTNAVGSLVSDAAITQTIGTGSRQIDGLIDEVRIYNRALSADEIGQLYRIGARKMGL